MHACYSNEARGLVLFMLIIPGLRTQVGVTAVRDVYQSTLSIG